MKIQFLGTAAAEGVPALFCNCRVCKMSRQSGGRNVRTRSQALVDDKILIDFPADTYMHTLHSSIDLPSIHTCIVTHSHHDHLYPMDLSERNHSLAHNISDEPLTFYGDYAAYAAVLERILQCKMDGTGRVAAKRITAFETFCVEGYEITPLRAAHDPKSDPVFYIIQKGGKTVMYGNDTGIFPDETWKWLEENPVRCDVVSLDCTLSPDDDWWGHMGLSSCIKVRDRLLKTGVADSATHFILHHFSHNSGMTYDELVPIADKEGFVVAYDGMITEF